MRRFRIRDLRVLASLVLSLLLIIFFVPILYNPVLFACRDPNALCLTNPSGLESLGYLFFHWGATYSTEEQSYSAPVVATLTDISVLLAYAFPPTVASIALLAPEIVRVSRIARMGFVAFGAFVFFLGILFLLSKFDPLIIAGVALAPMATLMVAYGTRILTFHTPESS